MGWGFPLSFLLLLGAIPLIILLHSLRPKGIKVKTTTLFLWERVLRERSMGRNLGWLLRKNLLLALQLLIALFLITALADPSLLKYGTLPGDAVIVIDLSASMKARGRSGTRFDDARKEFFALIDSLPRGQRIMVIGAASMPRILSPYATDKGRLKSMIRSLQPTDAPAQVKEAVLLAHSFLKPQSRDQVFVISDGAFDGAEELPWHSPHLRLIRVEGGNENVGITGFEFRRVPAKPAQYEIMIKVKNFTDHAIRTPLTLTVGDKRWVQEDLEIAPQESRVLVYPYRGALGREATARLGIEDDFPTDNQAFLALSESSPIRLLYAGKGDPFLDHLFGSLPQIQVTRVDRLEKDDLHSRLHLYDVVLINGIPSPPLTEGNFILIHTVADGIPLSVKGKVRLPRPLPSVTRHPLMEGVRLDDLYIREALTLAPAGTGTVLAHSKESPLIYAFERGRLRALVLGFDLSASDLPFRVAFPVLFSNAFDWFNPQRVEFPALQVQAGMPYPIHLPGSDDQVELTSPSGKREILRVLANPLPYSDTYEVGFYKYKSRSREGEFAVNLLSESESRIASRLPSGTQEAAGSKGGEEERHETGFFLWPFLLIIVFALLSAEAFLVFRRGGSFYPIVFRLLALAAIAFAMVNPRIFKAISALDVVLGVDFSRSVGQEGKETAIKVLEEARRIQGPDTRTGLLFFGRQPVWEFFPRGDFHLADFSPSVKRDETNIEAALQAALAQMGSGHQGRILLVSDGNENHGAAARVVPLLRSHGVPVWVLPVNLPRGRNEIYISDFTLPRQVDSAESFEVRGAIESLYEAPARIKLLRNGVIQRDQELILKPGTNRVSFRENLRDRGNHTFELLVESAEDTLAENNLLQGVVEVKGPPRVLYLHTQNSAQRFVSRALSVQGYSVVESLPEESPLSLPEISAFDLVVLDNVPAYRLSQSKMETLEKYVRDLGGGLVVIGGSQSYGAGGYYRTPLERILPVEIRPPSRIDYPRVAILFLLDKSGSMGAGPAGATKLDLAKAAAVSAADLLNPTDQIGILAFDAGWDWVLPFRQVGKGEWISGTLSPLESDGGTDLYKAMVEAYRSFSAKGAAIKHLLVLSDGLTDKADFHSLVTRMVQGGVTVSTVALGQDADWSLMAAIAKDGKGRAYITVDPHTVPQIFTSETLMVSRDLLVEALAYPKATSSSGPLKGLFEKRMPPVRGYVLTHPKPGADLLIRAEDDPLLVSWRYGLGTVAAFTSDLSGRWGKEWVEWEEFPQWVSQLARHAMRKISDYKIRAEIQPEGDEVKVVADFLSEERGFVNYLKLKGNLTGPDRSTRVIPFQQIAPGRYESRFSTPQQGIYLLTIHDEGQKGKIPSVATSLPFVAPYPREYRELKPNNSLLSRLAEETGGEVLDPNRPNEGLSRLFTPDPKKGRSAQETWWPLSGIGLLLFIADLALRRLPGALQKPNQRRLVEAYVIP